MNFIHDFGYQRPMIIASPELIQEKIDMLQRMLERSGQYESFVSDLNPSKNLLDVCFEHLEDSAEIKILNKSTVMYAQICNYVINTQLAKHSVIAGLTEESGASQVDEIFEVISIVSYCFMERQSLILLAF